MTISTLFKVKQTYGCAYYYNFFLPYPYFSLDMSTPPQGISNTFSNLLHSLLLILLLNPLLPLLRSLLPHSFFVLLLHLVLVPLLHPLLLCSLLTLLLLLPIPLLLSSLLLLLILYSLFQFLHNACS